jgi:hypothetical protein
MMSTDTKRITLMLASAALLFLLAGCSKREEPGSQVARGPALEPGSAHSASPASPHGNGVLKWTAPPEWVQETPVSSMRKAQYRLPRVAGDTDDAELAVFYFEGSGGSVQANIERWIGQFRKPDWTPASDTAKTTHKQSHGMPLTIVDVSGTYLAGGMAMPGNKSEKPGFRMLAAVAEASSGPWFFKLTGPAKTVARWKPAFESFLDTLR